MKKLVPMVLVLIAWAGCIGPVEEPSGDAGSGGSGSGDGSGGSASGGSQGSGGNNGSGGAVSASGGQTGSGGHDGSGGSGSGGSGSGGTGSGGVFGTGGSAASGGATGSGGSGPGGKGPGGATGSGGRGGGSGMTGSGGTVAAVCTSNKTWTSGNNAAMRPGNDCTSCHGFTIAGTIYPTLHEPNNCNGTAANGLKVVITGADGTTTTLTPNSTSGNFYSSTSIKTPFSAKVTNSAGGSRAMVATQTKGNCNSCHSQTGASSAPGRIMAP